MAQSVVGSLLIFNMQVEHLPVWVHKEFDKAMRKCVWGGVAGKRGKYLLNWDSICKPKEMGALI